MLIDDPRHRLTEAGTFRLSEDQARAILELRLQRLTALGRDEVGDEMVKLAPGDRGLSRHPALAGAGARHHQDRARRRSGPSSQRRARTEIVDQEGEVEDEDLIQREDMVVTVSHAGYIKRVPLVTYRAQRRGGKGRSAMQTREEDFVTKLFVANTHAPILFFSSRGMAYKMKVWRLPLGGPQARGKALVNLLPLAEGERITSIMPLPEDEARWQTLDVMFATARGTVRRNKLSDFTEINRNGKIAMKLDEGDRSSAWRPASKPTTCCSPPAAGNASASPSPRCGCSPARNSVGVRGIALGEGDSVISMSILGHFEAEPEERAAYMKMRRAIAGEGGERSRPATARRSAATRRPWRRSAMPR